MCSHRSKSGTIETDEYFVWALGMACQNGGGLEAVFKKYDSDGAGLLDLIEFSLAVEDLGFSATFASDIFLALDEDNSGFITYAEILTMLRARAGVVSNSTKKILASIAFQGVDRAEPRDALGEDAIKAIDTSSWKLVGPDEESLRKQIHHELVRCSLRDADLYALLTTHMGGAGSDDGEPLMTMFAFCCSPCVSLATIWHKVSSDRSARCWTLTKPSVTGKLRPQDKIEARSPRRLQDDIFHISAGLSRASSV